MLIENIMYFALGLFAAGLLALVLLPAVWKRAVRLTRRRIEAATPITLAEFRADKDQLRAEFALTTRKLEQTIETLRARVAEQLSEVNQARADTGMMVVERQRHAAELAERDAREEALRAELAERERDTADLAQRLRMRERELESRNAELAELREVIRADVAGGAEFDDTTLTGSYEEDVERLTTALAVARKRSSNLEEQARELVARLEHSDRRSAEANAAIAQMRDALASRGERQAAAELEVAEASIASAENRFTQILSGPEGATEGSSLADGFDSEAALEALRQAIVSVEETILGDGPRNDASLRLQLGEIAASVSRIVHAKPPEPENNAPPESLFERVQRFAEEEQLPPARLERKRRVSERMLALQEIRGS